MKSPQTKSIRLLQESHQENVEVMLKNLLKDETLSDITLHCKDGAVRAHRVILASSSPYFKKVFQEHPEHQVAFLLHGVTVKHIKSLVELMYRGTTQISSDLTGKLCDIADEFGIKGIVDENDKSLVNTSGRDTRFKGQKRVAVDFENATVEDIKPQINTNIAEERVSLNNIRIPEEPSPSIISTPLVEGLILKQEPEITPNTTPTIRLTAEARRRNNWAMKQRKYKCTLCPASFKRASHLSRHQLVHTGERPYACNQCDKAFSRHDKLKHHIKKTHEHMEYLGNMMEGSNDNDFYAVDHVNISNEEIEEPKRITREDLLAEIQAKVEVMPEQVLVSPSEAPEDLSRTPEPSEMPKIDSEGTSNSASVTEEVVKVDSLPQQKKGRGRPRKYPPVPRPLIKRPRGRPRLNQSESPLRVGFKLPSRSDNYDITNMPFGDLEYLTKPLCNENNSESFEDSNSMDNNFMEPLVEIELDSNKKEDDVKTNKEFKVKNEEKDEQKPILHHNSAGEFLQNIGLLETSVVAKMELGECTISVSSGTQNMT